MPQVKVFLSCLCAFLFLSGASSLYADDCNPIGCDSVWTRISDTVYVTGYPDCPIVVDYEKRNCNDVTEVKVTGFLWPDPANTDCDTILDRLDDTLANGDPDWNFIFWVFTDSHKKVLIKLFEEEYNNSPEQDSLACPGGQKTFRSYWGACRMLAVSVYGSGTHGNQYKSHNLNCGEQCCIETTEMCYDTLTNTVRAVVTTAPGGTGQNCGPQYAIIPPGTISTSVCMPACGVIPNYNDEEID